MFKAYDIRGVYRKEITSSFAFELGAAFAVWSKSKSIIVGRDCRIGSAELAKSLISGIISSGCNVVDIGLCTTPMLYFASRKGAAVMVTASHSPKEYVGFKLCLKNAVPVGNDSGLKEIQSLMGRTEGKGKGKIEKKDISQPYAKFVKGFAGKLPKLKIVADAGNGMEGIILEKLFKNPEIVKLNFKPDGKFPNRNPNPMHKGAMDELAKKVISTKADLGVSYDADCDRIFFVDENGNKVISDHIAILVAKQILSSKPRACIIGTVNISRTFDETLSKIGALVKRVKVGHSFIKENMKKHNAVFGAEVSGHFYYGDNDNADSGDITLMHVLSLMSESGRKLSELAKPLMKYFKSSEINISYESPKQGLELVKKHFKDAVEVNSIDGLTMKFKDWWFNLRASNTEPLMRLNAEADSPKLLEEKTMEIKKLFK